MDLFDWLHLGEHVFNRFFWQWLLPIFGLLAGAVMALTGQAWWWAPVAGGILLWIIVHLLTRRDDFID